MDLPQKPLVNKTFFGLGMALQLGFSIAVPLVLFISLGIWADKRFATMPFFTIAGVLLSLLVSGIEIREVIRNAQRKS